MQAYMNYTMVGCVDYRFRCRSRQFEFPPGAAVVGGAVVGGAGVYAGGDGV